MTYEELLLVAAVLSQGVLILWQLNSKKSALKNELEQLLGDAVEELDGRLAQALGSIAENMGMGGNFEPPNPFQQLIAQYIQSKIQTDQNSTQMTLNRDENGQFSTLKDEILTNDNE